MHRILVIGILIVVMLQPVYAVDKPSQSEPVPSTWTMQVPAGWLQIKPSFPQCLMATYDSNHTDHFVMVNVVYEVVGNVTLDQVFRAGEKSAPKLLENYKLLEHGDAKVGGLPAYYVINTFTNSDIGTLKSKCFVVIRKGIAYTFTCSCLTEHFSEHSKDFDSIVKSVKWMEPPAK